MSNLLANLKNMFKPIDKMPAGMYHYQAPQDDPRNYRLHLRVDSDGKGILLVNAATVLHLNQTATEYAYHLIKNTSPQETAKIIASRYRINQSQALSDYQDFTDRINNLISTPDLDPVTFLDFDRDTPYSKNITAPFRLDCAITYQLPANADPNLAPTKRVSRELSTDEWRQVMDKAWQAGIPHVIFTGGEPTLRNDLVDLISHAEKNGQVSGLCSDGLRFTDKEYLNSLLQTGLDHVLFILQPEKEESWVALQNLLDGDIFVAVHLTVSPQIANTISILNKLCDMHVPAISLSAAPDTPKAALEEARERVAQLLIDLVWDLPVPYSTTNPITLELEDHEKPQGAGNAWLYVEPDGDVLAAQGFPQVLGNFLTDPWEKIWSSRS
jgi:organic radical activating enzyme